MAVKPSGAEQGRVQNVGAVCGGNHDNALIGVKPVHFHQQLVERLLALVVSAAQPCAAQAPHGVNLIDEDESRAVRFGGLKQVAHARRADAHKHLHKIGAADVEERHACLARHRTRQQSLTAAGRTQQQYTLGDFRAQRLILARVFEVIHNLGELLLRFVYARHIVKSDAGDALVVALRARLTERERLIVARLRGTHQQEPD
ncbi:hypothetical protein HRbin14_01985 [bacterium HR14]|nr:hypothetical protein HRbin14_01985 [bacterium HR14]